MLDKGTSSETTRGLTRDIGVRANAPEPVDARVERLANVGHWEWDFDRRQGRWSPGMYRVLGISPGVVEATYPQLLELVHPEDRTRADAVIQGALRRQGTWTLERRIVGPDGSQRILYGRGEVDGSRRTVFGVERDVTGLFSALEHELHEAQARYRELVERLPAVSYVAEPGAAGVWHFVSPQIEELLGYSPTEWLADPNLWAHCIDPDDRMRVVEEEEREAASGAPVATEYRMITRNGRRIWVRDEAVLNMRDDGQAVYDGLLTDITARRRYEAKLRMLADHDALTGVLNRRRFIQDLDRELKLLDRHGFRGALMIVDLDKFKDINDSRGHLAGDTMIRAVASVLSLRVRETDTIGRLGGDEFAVLLRGTGAEEAEGVAEQILAALRRRDRRFAEPVTASAGIVELTRGLTIADALAEADGAMYAAKQRGGDCAVVVPSRSGNGDEASTEPSLR